jgi:hypothetical protein
MSVIRHMRGHPARAARLALWAGTVSGLVLIAVAGGDLRQLRTMDNLGALLFVGCPAVLIAWWARRHMPVRIARDDILTQRVTRAETRIDACEQKTGAILTNIGDTAAIAGVPMQDNDETIPQLRIVGGESRLCGAAAGSPFLVPFLLGGEPDGLAPVGEDLCLLSGDR